MVPLGRDFKSLRQWDGSQHRAFEELCYQIRDPTPEGARLVKTGNPDGGLEWYVTLPDDVQWGWQAKFTFEIDTLLNLMEKSLKTVVEKRPNCKKLTFCIPFDLPDAPGTGERKSARQKFEDRKQSWGDRIPGADRVRIELSSEGDLLQRLVGHSNHRGIEKFFWDNEVFSPEWCAKRMEKTVREAGGRYTPELHIDLPVSFALEGLARSKTYWRRFRYLRAAVLEAASHLRESHFPGLGFERKLQRLGRSVAEWEGEVSSEVKPPTPLARTRLLEVTHSVLEATGEANQHENPASSEHHRSLQYYLGRLLAALRDFEDLLKSTSTKAANCGALLLTGGAGQGKTHLFCDAGQRAVGARRPAILILGGQLSGRQVWSEIADRLGLGQVGSEVLIGAMQAAAEASNAPFMLLIDALNEAEDPRRWQNELPGLIAETVQNPWISIGISVRSTYRKIVLPPDGLSDIAEVEHRGFTGRELEATEQFFSTFGLEQPGIPLLASEFTNPLFLKLYCEGLKEMGLSALPAGETYVSNVFNHYMESKAGHISNRLELDPGTRPVQGAIEAFCKALAKANRDRLSRDHATEIINKYAPDRNHWPDTMLGGLLSEGVLTADVAWDSDSANRVEVIGFTYQRYADYRVGSALLGPLDGNPERLRESLADGQPLHKKLVEAPLGWIEALAVQMPERFGVELLDVVQLPLDSPQRYLWDEAFVRSIAARRPSAVTERSGNLLNEVQDRSPDLFDLVLETVLSVAPTPDHPLNAEFLHKWLMSMPMPERDVAWSVPTYLAFDEGGTLDRLIRWAAQGPYPNCRNEVVELAAVPIVWTFTSPNRRMRDYATKALSSLLSGHLFVLPSLINRFEGVDDPYVIERLAVVTHGAVLCGGCEEKKQAVAIAKELKRVALAETQVPNVLTRDAVRGTYEWCTRHGLINQSKYQEVLPPYGSAPPGKPRTKEELKEKYGGEEVDGHDIRFPYGNLFSSIFNMGDFGKYVIQSKLESFSRFPLCKPQIENPRRHAWTEWPEELAQRWVFERVLSYGWTPERFAEFDQRQVRYQTGRSGHKPERIGKKYQWIALRELIARIADNFHMTSGLDHQQVTYLGPWQFYGRDIDPTLPPPRRIRNDDDGFELISTFSFDSEKWWRPQGPCFRWDHPVAIEGWAMGIEDIPELDSIIKRKDGSETHWVPLCLYCNWYGEISEPQERRSPLRGNFWCSIRSWLVQPADRDALVEYLEGHSHMGRQMPEGSEYIDTAYLGELPWGPAVDKSPEIWCPIEVPEDSHLLNTKVYPAWAEYLWEGNVLDCSINDSVQTYVPAPILYEEGKLAWVPGSREWKESSGLLVARYLEEGDHLALFVREDWLERTLRETGHSIIFVLLGEKQLLERSGYVVGDWRELNAVASLSGNGWTFGRRQLKRSSSTI